MSNEAHSSWTVPEHDSLSMTSEDHINLSLISNDRETTSNIASGIMEPLRENELSSPQPCSKATFDHETDVSEIPRPVQSIYTTTPSEAPHHLLTRHEDVSPKYSRLSSHASTARLSNCSTFLIPHEQQARIDYIWCGESLGLDIQRYKRIYSSPLVLVWKEGSVGLTFGIEQATRQVVVKRTTRTEHNVLPGDILTSANGEAVSERNFDETMRNLKAGHEAGVPQILTFVPPPAPPIVKSVVRGGVLDKAGVNSSYELISVNGVQTRYLKLDEIAALMRQSVKPCELSFCLSSQAQELRDDLETTKAQGGATLAIAAALAAICI
jgi:hypothetical protein